MSTPGDTVELAWRIAGDSMSKEMIRTVVAMLNLGATPEAVSHIITEFKQTIGRRRRR